MPPPAEKIEELTGVGRTLPDAVLKSTKPLVLRGVAADWPLVKAGLQSAQAASDYLRGFYRQETVAAMLAGPDAAGRLFYNDEFTGYNFKQVPIKLDTVLEQILQYRDDPRPPTLYVGSTTIDIALPGLRAQNDFDFGGREPLVSIWVGNRTRIAAHNDLPDNLACVAVGRRRFTLFPPEQLHNLYVGPLEYNPAGQAVSLVDFHNPDLSRFPRFAEALKHAHVAELGPGDALFIPSLWWHHIESLEPLNVLVNYWWRQSPSYMDTPMHALFLAIMTVRNLPLEQRKAMEAMFDEFVFDPSPERVEHIPPQMRGMLGPLNEDWMRRMRTFLVQRLNR